MLDKHPEAARPHDAPQAVALHLAALAGHLAVVNLLLARGIDVNLRDDAVRGTTFMRCIGPLRPATSMWCGGSTTPAEMWSVMATTTASRSWLGDVLGRCDDDVHRAIVEFLISRGARHHIFSAIAMNLAGEVRRIG